VRERLDALRARGPLLPEGAELGRQAGAESVRNHRTAVARAVVLRLAERRHDEREYSFVDATSFAPLMRSMRIKRVPAFDGDFAAAGFTELRPAGA
jgi:predicted nucleic acid-binding protein